MGYYKHFIDKTTQQKFLKERRKDSVLQQNFEPGDNVVICAKCKSAFLEDSWLYQNEQHCKQSQTLKTLNGITGDWVGQEATITETPASVDNNLPEKSDHRQYASTSTPVAKSGINRPVVLLTVLVIGLLSVLLYNQYAKRTSVSGTVNLSSAPHFSEYDIKSKVKEILNASEKKSGGSLPDRTTLEGFYEDEIRIIGPTENKTISRHKLINRVYNYLDQISWDTHKVNDGSWQFESYDDYYRISFEGVYKAYSSGKTQKIYFKRTYKINQNLKVFYQKDEYELDD